MNQTRTGNIPRILEPTDIDAKETQPEELWQHVKKLTKPERDRAHGAGQGKPCPAPLTISRSKNVLLFELTLFTW